MVNPIVACSQISCSWDQDENINKAEKIITDAVKEGCEYIFVARAFFKPIFLFFSRPKIF